MDGGFFRGLRFSKGWGDKRDFVEQEGKMSEQYSIAVVVVTYNRKDLLRECLKALLAQTRFLNEIIVVDNASVDGTDRMISEEFPQITYVRLPENTGAAGGFHEGMKLAYQKGYHWIWVMDDDAKASVTCLEQLLSYAEQADVLVPIKIDLAGRKYGMGFWRGRTVAARFERAEEIMPIEMFSFVGPLISRKVVDRIGFPRKDLFMCAEDYEYALRVRASGFRCKGVLNAIIFHHIPFFVKRGRIRYIRPAWRYYYDTRNRLLMLVNLGPGERLTAYLWAIYFLLRTTIEAILYEPDWKNVVRYKWLGFWHGALGISGKRVVPFDEKRAKPQPVIRRTTTIEGNAPERSPQ